MNENELKGNWQIVKGKVREKWGKLTDQDIDVIAGKRDQLVGKLRERYGHAQGESERLVKEFEEGRPRTTAHRRSGHDLTPSIVLAVIHFLKQG